MLDLNAMRAAKAEVSEWLRTNTMAGMPTADRIVERACVAYAKALSHQCPRPATRRDSSRANIVPHLGRTIFPLGGVVRRTVAWQRGHDACAKMTGGWSALTRRPHSEQ